MANFLVSLSMYNKSIMLICDLATYWQPNWVCDRLSDDLRCITLWSCIQSSSTKTLLHKVQLYLRVCTCEAYNYVGDPTWETQAYVHLLTVYLTFFARFRSIVSCIKSTIVIFTSNKILMVHYVQLLCSHRPIFSCRVTYIFFSISISLHSLYLYVCINYKPQYIWVQ